MDEQQQKTRAGLRAGLSVVVLAILAVALVQAAFSWTSNSTELTPGDFSGKVTSSQRLLPIGRAYIEHSKGGGHHIQIVDPFADLLLSYTDYTENFGASEDIRPKGYCLEATIEQSGSGIRLMYPSGRPIPEGKVRRC